MTAEERRMLEDLAEKLHKTQAPPPDTEAEEFIRKNIGSRPDALYLMTQTVLIQNLALEHAQRQIHELQERTAQPAQAGSGTSFLGGAAPSGGGYAQSRYAGSSGPPPPQYNAPSPAPPSPSGTGTFLRGAAQTAAGVAAGALAFEGIRSLFSHPGFGGYGGFGGGYGYMGAPMGETIIENNYYDQPQDTSQVDFQDQQDDGNVQDVGDSGQFDDGSNFDDSGDMGDDGGFDDGGSWT